MGNGSTRDANVIKSCTTQLVSLFLPWSVAVWLVTCWWMETHSRSQRVLGGTEVTELQFDPGCAGPLLQSWEQRASSPPCLHPALEGKSWQAESFCPARTVLKMLKFI